MRSLLFIFLLAFSIGCTGTKKIATTTPGKTATTNTLDGTWVPVKEELANMPQQNENVNKHQLIISGGTYTFTAESVDKGTLKYKDGKMDIYGKEGVNAGKHFTAIYMLENGQLTIIYNLKGDSYPETFEVNKPLLFLAVFKRADAK